MTKAVHARRRGDDFQAYCFWKPACHMLMPRSDIERVGFELGSPYIAFDDIAVIYKTGRPWRGQRVLADFTQVKHSVNYAKALTFGALCDPHFINATSVSFLQRLSDAVKTMLANGDDHRFVLLAPWSIQPDDVLAQLLCCENGSLNLDRLFDGTGPKGTMGRLRRDLVEHLSLSTEDELPPILSRLQIDVSQTSLERLREQLSLSLAAARLRQIDLSVVTDDYSQLPWRLHQDGVEWHTAQSLRTRMETVITPAVADEASG